MTKINQITIHGYNINFNQYLYHQSEFRSLDYTIYKGDVVLFSTKDQKCCWCDVEPMVSENSCQHCLDLLKDQNWNAKMECRNKSNDVLVIEHQEIATEFDGEKLDPYDKDAPYFLICTTKTAETTERRAQIQMALNALADECGLEYPVDFEARMQRIVEKTKDGKEHYGLKSILYAVTNLGATAQETRIMLNIWSDELRLFEDKVAKLTMADVGTKKK